MLNSEPDGPPGRLLTTQRGCVICPSLQRKSQILGLASHVAGRCLSPALCLPHSPTRFPGGQAAWTQCVSEVLSLRLRGGPLASPSAPHMPELYPQLPVQLGPLSNRVILETRANAGMHFKWWFSGYQAGWAFLEVSRGSRAGPCGTADLRR